MPSRTICSYRNCRNSATKSPHLSFHRFPHNENTTDWIIRSGNDSLFELTPKQLSDKRVCSEHFDKSAFFTGNRLLRSALPNMYSMDDSSDHDEGTNDSSPTLNPANLPPQELFVNNVQPVVLNIDENREVVGRSINSEPSQVSDNNLELKVNNRVLNIDRTSHISCENDKNALIQKITMLEKRLTNAERIIRNLRKSQNTRRATINTVFADAAKFLNQNQLLLLQMQFKRLLKTKTEWTSWEKSFACSLYNISPDAYIFLQRKQKITLPRINSVRQWIEKINSPMVVEPEVISLKEGDIVVIPDQLIPIGSKKII